MIKSEKQTWYYIYRGLDLSKSEIYFVVSENGDGVQGQGNSYFVGATGELEEWNNKDNNSIRWNQVSKYDCSKKACDIIKGFNNYYRSDNIMVVA